MKSNTVIDSLLNAQEVPAVIIDEQHRIIAANRAYCTSYGVEGDSIIGRHCYEVSHHLSVPCYQNGEDCPCLSVLATNSPFEVLHIHYDCANRPDRVRIKAYPVETAGGASGSWKPSIAWHPPCTSPVKKCAWWDARRHSCNAWKISVWPPSPACRYCSYGETGVGKEMAAEYIHRQSKRSSKPYVELNCAAIPETLFENELFGHERGAFTGCVGVKQGLCELADKGTLFLDEIAELPLTMQAKLLRVLDTGEFRRLGGTTIIKIDVRIIAATNCDLRDMVARGGSAKTFISG